MPKKATKKSTAKRKSSRASAAKKTAVRKASTKRATTARKKAASKRTATKRAATRTTKAAVKKAKPIKKISDKLTKSQLLLTLSEQTGLSKKEVSSVFDSLENVIAASIKKGAFGSFTLPGIAKIVTVHKPATKARKGINPFTGEETTFKAKPARTVVKVRPLKKLKDMV